jgi:hypothetical protein
LAEQFVNQTSQHVFLTGKAGTGKTTFLKHIVQTTHKHAVVAAPTGVAAINAGGVTLHSLFQLSFAPHVPDESNKQDISHFSQQKLDVLRKMELLIIDEVSMLRVDTLDAIDAVLRRVRHTTRTFGGVQMLYIGDMFQLPPVVNDEEWAILHDYYPSQFFFHAHALKKIPPVYIELKKVYRQQDRDFINLLNKVRNNVMQPSDFELLNRRYIKNFVPPEDKKFIMLTTHNYQADRINSDKLNELKTQIYEFKGIIKDNFPDYMLPAENTLRLKKGAQIMFVKNDSSLEKQYYNGKIGTITKISNNEIMALCENETTEITLHTETWENKKYTLNKESGEMEEELLGAFTQYPLRLAWAITVHKSQGLTFNNVILDISRAFAAGQAYVALSRCTSIEGIVLQSPVSPACIQTDSYAIELSQKERPQSELEDTLKNQKKIFWTERLKDYFSLKYLYSIFYSIEKLLKDKTGVEYKDAKVLLDKFRKFADSQKDTIIKFQNQLQNLTANTDENSDFSQIKNRCQKAVEYYYPLYIKELLLPLRENIDNFHSAKKAKTYFKNLLEIEKDLTLFIEDLKKVEYFDKALIDSKSLVIPERYLREIPKTQKQNKGDSAKLSLELMQQGKSMAEICKERNLKESTIMEHLSRYISTNQVSIFSLVPPEKVAKILPLIESVTQSGATPVKEQLGDGFSYDEIRAVARYYALTNKAEKSVTPF